MSEVSAAAGQVGAPISVATFLDSLPEEEKFILTLHLLRGLTPAAIAQAIGVPPRAVESVITIGKSRLIAALNEGQMGSD